MLEFILSIVAFVLFVAVAAIASAIQDVNKTKWNESVFNRPEKKTKIFGFVWNDWFAPDSWLNKYQDRDPSTGKHHKFKILFFKIYIIQLTDGWHFFKMIKIGAWLLAAVSIGFVAWFYYQFNPDLIGWIATSVGLFLGGGLNWNLIFNLFFDDLLRKK